MNGHKRPCIRDSCPKVTKYTEFEMLPVQMGMEWPKWARSYLIFILPTWLFNVSGSKKSLVTHFNFSLHWICIRVIYLLNSDVFAYSNE